MLAELGGYARSTNRLMAAATPASDPFGRAAIGCCLLFLAALVGVVALAASYWPARRAAALDPGFGRVE